MSKKKRPPSKRKTKEQRAPAERLYSVNALSEKLLVDRRTLKKYLSDLAPARLSGKSKLYRLEDVKQIIDGASSAKTTIEELRIKQIREQTRESTARADLLEMERKERAKELVCLDEVAAIINPILLAVRQRLNAMPSELSILVNPTDPVHAQQQAMAWVERTLPLIRERLPQPKVER